MTERTTVIAIRLENEDKQYISKFLTRECVEGMIRQMKRGEIELTQKGVVVKNSKN